MKYPNRKSGIFSAMVAGSMMLALAPPHANAQSAKGTTLLALSKADHVLAIIDPVTLKVTGRLPVGPDPHEVIASDDGSTAYVTIYGGGSLHELDVLDLVHHKALPPVDTRPLWGPHGITFVDGKVWFTAEGSKAVGRYDPASKKLDWSMGTGQDRTHMIYVSSHARRIYTTNVSSGTVSILVDTLLQPGNMPPPPGQPGGNRPPPPGFGPHRQWVQTIVPTARGAEGFDVSPDSAEIWTASADNGNIYIINAASGTVDTVLAAGVKGANRLKFTPDGQKVLVTSLSQGDLVIFDAAARREVKRVPVGHGAAGILLDPGGNRAFVACTPDNYIAVVDLGTWSVTGHIALGGPDGLAWATRR